MTAANAFVPDNAVVPHRGDHQPRERREHRIACEPSAVVDGGGRRRGSGVGQWVCRGLFGEVIGIHADDCRRFSRSLPTLPAGSALGDPKLRFTTVKGRAQSRWDS